MLHAVNLMNVSVKCCEVFLESLVRSCTPGATQPPHLATERQTSIVGAEM